MKHLFGKVLSGLLLLGLASSWMVGCGGSGRSGAAATGTATLRIVWPETTTRLIPAAARSITATFRSAGNVIQSKTVARPDTGGVSTVSFTGLPATTMTLTASAFPNADGTGTAQATASKVIVIQADTTNNLSITMASTVNSILVTPTTPAIGVGEAVTLVATALDSEGRTVLLSTGTTTWSSNATTVATVNSSGVVSGVSAGSAQITFTESESGKTGAVTVIVGGGGGTRIVDLATAYLSTLSASQRAASLMPFTAANAAKWSNVVATPNTEDGTNALRHGVAFSTLTPAQKTAWTNLVQTALGTSGLDKFNQVRRAGDFLSTTSTDYSGDFVYVGFVGTPSTSGSWLLQVGGHQYTINSLYTGETLKTSTPYFLGTEPRSFTQGGTPYAPLDNKRDALKLVLDSLSTAQLNSASISGTFDDVLLGPGKDARSNFPTTGRGLAVSTLTVTQKNLIKDAISKWTQDSIQGAVYQALYDSEIDQTFVAFSGSTGLNGNRDYIRIDGPHVWIEFLVKGASVGTGLQYHSVWRDRVSDYNAAFTF